MAGNYLSAKVLQLVMRAGFALILDNWFTSVPDIICFIT